MVQGGIVFIDEFDSNIHDVYYDAFQMPVFSCDSGLYFDNVPDQVQPGVHVRNVNGKCLSDEEMLDYCGGLAKQYGKRGFHYNRYTA